MIYRIAVTYANEETESKFPRRVGVTRRRRDAAHGQLIEIVRSEVRAIAGLDTAWGVGAINEAINADVTKGGSIAVGNHSRVWFSCSWHEPRPFRENVF